MLNIFRESARTWAIKALIWFVALTFVGAAFLVWGQGGARRDDIVAVAGDIQISRANYSDQIRKVEDGLRKQFPGQINTETLKALNPPAIAMNALIGSALQMQEARKAGIEVTDAEIRDYITRMPEFQRGGVFSSRNYLGVLKRNGFTAKAFEDNLKSDLLTRKLQSIVESAVHVSNAEAVDIYLDRRQPLVVEYVIFRPEDFRSKIKADKSEIKEWFEEKKERFAVPEERSFSMLMATPKSMADSVSVDDEYLKSYFDEHVSEFETEEQVKAGHILAQVSLAASKKEADAARSKMEKALKRIEAGEDFAVVAKDMSEGPSAQAGGDLGSFPKGQMVKKFEDVVFGLKPGEVSKPFRTEFGWHIVKTYSHTPMRVPKFEEIKDKIEQKAREAKAWEMADDLISSLSASLLAGQFDDSAKSHEGLKLKRYKAVKGAPIPGIDEWKVVSNVVFDIEKGTVSEPLELSGGFAVLTLNSITPPRIPALDEIKDKVKESFIEERSYDMVRTSAGEMEKEVSGGKSFKEAAKAGGHKVLMTKPYSKASLSDPKTKVDEGMVREAFSMEVGETGAASTRVGSAVFMLSSRGDVDLKEMKAGLPAFRRSLARAKKARVYTEYLAALRKRAEGKGEIEILIDVKKMN